MQIDEETRQLVRRILENPKVKRNIAIVERHGDELTKASIALLKSIAGMQEVGESGSQVQVCRIKSYGGLEG
jgi:hypothetical protein